MHARFVVFASLILQLHSKGGRRRSLPTMRSSLLPGQQVDRMFHLVLARRGVLQEAAQGLADDAQKCDCPARHCSYGLSGTKDCPNEGGSVSMPGLSRSSCPLWCRSRRKKRLAIVALDKEVYAAKLKLDELRGKRKDMAMDYKGLVKEMGMLKEEMLKTPPAEVEAPSVVHLPDIDSDSESHISGSWPKEEPELMLTEVETGYASASATEQVRRVPDQTDRSKYIQMLAGAFEKVMPAIPVQTVDLTDAQADSGVIAHAAQVRLQAQAAEVIASTVFSIVEDMKPVFCKPRDRFAPY